MNLNNFFNVLAGESSRNFKIAELERFKDNAVLKRVCFLALDPFTQFYIRKIPKYQPNGGPSIALAFALDTLNDLSSRRITGNAAIEHLRATLEALDQDDAQVLERVIQKDLKCGVSESTVNKVWPGLVPEYPCMLASAYEQKLVDKVKFPAYVQLKLDGMRFNAIVRNGVVEFRSRNGKEIQIADPTFADPFITMSAGADVVFDGELLVRDKSGNLLDRKTGNGILNKAVKGTQTKAEGEMVCATLWDVIPFDKFNEGKWNVQYGQRFADLIRLTSLAKSDRVSVVENDPVDSIEQAQALFEQYLAAGQEGVILKTKDMIWENKRSKHQIKFKGELECDLKVVDWVEGTGKNVGRMGALILESSDGAVKVGVGTGFTDADRMAIGRDVIGSIVAIKYNARVTDKRSDVDSLFLPVFIEIRSDKTVADSSKDIK